jgi:hypothetical protein
LQTFLSGNNVTPFKSLRPQASRFVWPSFLVVAILLALAPRDSLVDAPQPSPSQSAVSIVAPNLMIVMGNGYSMRREMDDQTTPDAGGTYMPFLDALSGNTPLAWPQHNETSPAQAPSSKFYQAKQAITSIMDDDTLSANINVGFATWRTTFAQPLRAIRASAQTTGGRAYPVDSTIISAPTPQRYSYADNPDNFIAVGLPLWPEAGSFGTCPTYLDSSLTRDRPSGYNAIVGRGVCDGGKNVIKDSVANYRTSVGGIGGIPTVVVPDWPLSAATPADGRSFNSFAPNRQDNASAFSNYLYGDPSGINIPNRAFFCGTYYTSESNEFSAWYLFEKPYYAGSWAELAGVRGGNYDVNGSIVSNYDTSCSGQTIRVNTGSKIIGTKVLQSPGVEVDALSTTILPFGVWVASQGFSMPNGVLSGWSGENTMLDGGTATETVTASYPSGPANPENIAIPGRMLKSRNLIARDIAHMGPFLDLPDPAAGYVDQRQVIRDFMLPVQMSASGTEYDPITQKIAPGGDGKSTKGIRASDDWSDGQSPVHDSLLGAAAYYDAYKKVDPNDTCRSNHVLLLYDGKENARYVWDAATGQRIWADPADVAQKLKNDLNVFTHVIIISRVSGDIAEANRIAQKGGTATAYSIGDYTQLQAALRNVFANLQTKIAMTSPAVPLFTRGGDYAYTPVSLSQPSFGTLEAHPVLPTGLIDPAKTWDADAKMTIAGRTANLFTNNGAAKLAIASVPDALFAIPPTSTLTGTQIRGFTIDPSFNSGAFLAGRKTGSFIGRTSNTPPVIVDRIMSPELGLDPTYKTYTKALPADHKVVLFSSNDGFLYAVNQANAANEGELRWGWMPSRFLPQLKQFDSFQGQKVMDGDLRVADVKNGGGFNRYVLGVANRGAIQYALELSQNSDFLKVAWVDENPTGPGDPKFAPEVVREAGVAYAVYTRGKKLIVRNIVTGVATERDLASVFTTGEIQGFHVSGRDAVMGSKTGEVYSVGIFDAAAPVLIGTMKSAGGGTPNEVSVTAITTAVVDGLRFILAQSNTRLTVFSKAIEATAAAPWTRVWSTSSNGGVDAAAGALTPPEPLPASSRISAPAAIVEGIVYAPVTVDGAGTGTQTSCLTGAAMVYFYDLKKATFPKDRLIDKESGAAVTGAISIGSGDALRLRLTQLEGGQIGGIANSQAAGLSGKGPGAGLAPQLIYAKLPATKIIWMKEMDRDSY